MPWEEGMHHGSTVAHIYLVCHVACFVSSLSFSPETLDTQFSDYERLFLPLLHCHGTCTQ